MAGAPHQRAATVSADGFGQLTTALNVENNIGARGAREQVAGVQHHQAISPNDFAFWRNHTKAIAITIKGNTKITAVLFDGGDQVAVVVWVAGVWVVRREIAIHLHVQWHNLAAQCVEQALDSWAGNAVAAIDGNFHRSGKNDIAGNLIHVTITDVLLAYLAFTAGQLTAGDAFAQV